MSQPRESFFRGRRWTLRTLTSLAVAAATVALAAGHVPATTIGPDAYGYTATDSVPFAFEDISGTGTRVLAGVDDSYVTVPLGFTFNIYGTDYTSVSINSNGLLTFGGATNEYANIDLTTGSPGADIPSIAVLWDDWQFFQSGADAVYYETLGSPGSRRFVATWRIAYGYYSSPSDVTFQAILSETTNLVLLQYLDVDSGDFRSFGGTATVGLRDTGGHLNGRNLQWSLNSPVIANGQAILISACNHDGVIDAGEECDDANGTGGDGCSAACRIEECFACSGAPSTCTPAMAGSACGSSLDDDCANPDTCDGSGTCLANDEPSSSPCAGDGNDCTQDVCDGSGLCVHPFESSGTACGSPADTDCTHPDTCDGSGTCLANDEPSSSPCTGDGNECTQDVCDGSGLCVHPFESSGTACGSPADTDCTHPDTCDGSGTCLANDEPSSSPCTGDGNECTQDVCDGSGLCVHPFESSGTACGSPADTDCANPDTCDGSGTCLSNDETAGTPCGDPSDTQCTNPDSCNGSGVCLANHELAGTACGDSSSTECTAPDTCNGSGSCLDNHAANLTPCHGSNDNTCLNACTGGSCVPHFFTNCCGNGLQEGAEICDDHNQQGGDECLPSCRLALESYQCYRAGVLSSHPAPPLKVLINQYHTINAQVRRPMAICNPASANGDFPLAAQDPDHLELYSMQTDPRRDIALLLPQTDQKVVDRFGTLYVDAIRTSGLLVPTAKELSSLPPAPVAPGVDHFACYKVKRSKKRPAFQPVSSVIIDDQFGTVAVKVLRPSRLCLPTNKYDEAPGAESHMTHLMCYRVRAQFSSPGRVFTNNQFGAGELYVRFPNELCVPAVRNPL